MRILRAGSVSCLTLLFSLQTAAGAAPAGAPAKGDAQAVQLLQKAQIAMGGADKLAAIKDTTQTLTVKLEPPFQKHSITQTIRFIPPSQIRQEQDGTMGKMIVHSNGYSGEKTTKHGTSPLKLDGITASQGVILRQLCTLMLSDRDPSRTVKSVGPSAVEIASGGQKVKVEFDPKTGLPVKQIYAVPVDGRSVMRTETLSDWRQVNGVRLPFHGVQVDEGIKIMEFTVSAYKINTGLTWADLSKR